MANGHVVVLNPLESPNRTVRLASVWELIFRLTRQYTSEIEGAVQTSSPLRYYPNLIDGSVDVQIVQKDKIE